MSDQIRHTRPVRYEPVAVSADSTVVAEFVPDPASATAYQSEADLEKALVGQLKEQAYAYLPITTEGQLIANLRDQLEALNGIRFSDAEWQRFFTERIASANSSIVDKTVRIHEDHVQLLTRDDGSTKNVMLIDKVHIHNNRLQVINQYEAPGPDAPGGGRHAKRYDVTVLVNGLPIVHIELKRRGVEDIFWSGCGLFEYVQLFVISNGTLTILMLVEKHRAARGDGEDKEMRRAIELAQIVDDESLKPAETQAFVDMAFRDGAISKTGTAVTRILPPASRFAGPGAGHADTKRRVLEKLTHFFDRYVGLGGGINSST